MVLIITYFWGYQYGSGRNGPRIILVVGMIRLWGIAHGATICWLVTPRPWIMFRYLNYVRQFRNILLATQDSYQWLLLDVLIEIRTHSTSITPLENGRRTELLHIPGRSHWVLVRLVWESFIQSYLCSLRALQVVLLLYVLQRFIGSYDSLLSVEMASDQLSRIVLLVYVLGLDHHKHIVDTFTFPC